MAEVCRSRALRLARHRIAAVLFDLARRIDPNTRVFGSAKTAPSITIQEGGSFVTFPPPPEPRLNVGHIIQALGFEVDEDSLQAWKRERDKVERETKRGM